MINKEFDEIIISRFIMERERRGLSREALAMRAGLPRSSIGYYERLQRSMPLDIYKKLCAFFGFDYAELFDEAQKEFFEREKKRDA